MAYSVGDFKKMMKDAYKTAFGYRGATGLIYIADMPVINSVIVVNAKLTN